MVSRISEIVVALHLKMWWGVLLLTQIPMHVNLANEIKYAIQSYSSGKIDWCMLVPNNGLKLKYMQLHNRMHTCIPFVYMHISFAIVQATHHICMNLLTILYFNPSTIFKYVCSYMY